MGAWRARKWDEPRYRMAREGVACSERKLTTAERSVESWGDCQGTSRLKVRCKAIEESW